MKISDINTLNAILTQNILENPKEIIRSIKTALLDAYLPDYSERQVVLETLTSNFTPVFHGTFAGIDEPLNSRNASKDGNRLLNIDSEDLNSKTTICTSSKELASFFTSEQLFKLKQLEQEYEIARDSIKNLTGETENTLPSLLYYNKNNNKETFSPEILEKVYKHLETINTYNDYVESLSDDYFTPDYKMDEKGKIFTCFIDSKFSEINTDHPETSLIPSDLNFSNELNKDTYNNYFGPLDCLVLKDIHVDNIPGLFDERSNPLDIYIIKDSSQLHTDLNHICERFINASLNPHDLTPVEETLVDVINGHLKYLEHEIDLSNPKEFLNPKEKSSDAVTLPYEKPSNKLIVAYYEPNEGYFVFDGKPIDSSLLTPEEKLKSIANTITELRETIFENGLGMSDKEFNDNNILLTKTEDAYISLYNQINPDYPIKHSSDSLSNDPNISFSKPNNPENFTPLVLSSHFISKENSQIGFFGDIHQTFIRKDPSLDIPRGYPVGITLYNDNITLTYPFDNIKGTTPIPENLIPIIINNSKEEISKQLTCLLEIKRINNINLSLNPNSGEYISNENRISKLQDNLSSDYPIFIDKTFLSNLLNNPDNSHNLISNSDKISSEKKNFSQPEIWFEPHNENFIQNEKVINESSIDPEVKLNSVLNAIEELKSTISEHGLDMQKHELKEYEFLLSKTEKIYAKLSKNPNISLNSNFNLPNVSLKNQTKMENKPEEKAVKVGFAKLHTFEADPEKNMRENTVFNVTLFEKEIQDLIPKEGGKFKIHVVENPNDPEKFTVSTARGPEMDKVKLTLDLNSDVFKKGADESLKVNNGYIDLTASKMAGKDSYSVYQHQGIGNNKYVGFASEPNPGKIIGTVFENKTEAGIPYKTALINPAKIDSEKMGFINIHKTEDPTKLVAFSNNKPNRTAEVVIQLSKKGKEFFNTQPNNADVRISIASRKPESITPQMNFSDLNVFFYNKDKKESIYLGTAWSNEQFKSLPQDVAESISQQKPLAKTAETSLAVGDVVEFKYDKDYYINTAVEKGLMPDAVAAGTIKSLNKDGSYFIESYVGDVNVQAKNVSGTDNPTLYDRQNSYETIKSEIDKSVKIEAPEKKQTPKAEKAKGESKEKAVKQEKGEKQEKSASKATSKPKTKGSELSM